MTTCFFFIQCTELCSNEINDTQSLPATSRMRPFVKGVMYTEVFQLSFSSFVLQMLILLPGAVVLQDKLSLVWAVNPSKNTHSLWCEAFDGLQCGYRLHHGLFYRLQGSICCRSQVSSPPPSVVLLFTRLFLTVCFPHCCAVFCPYSRGNTSFTDGLSCILQQVRFRDGIVWHRTPAALLLPKLLRTPNYWHKTFVLQMLERSIKLDI